MKKQSAGILIYKRVAGDVRVLIGHPGGPFWAKKDNGAWSIPKGEFLEGEDPFTVAKREFAEELGLAAPQGDYTELGQFKQPSGKIVHVWALQHDLDISKTKSNTFEMEWPPKSGKTETFPEIDRAGWFDLKTTKKKVTKGQVQILESLEDLLGANSEQQLSLI